MYPIAMDAGVVCARIPRDFLVKLLRSVRVCAMLNTRVATVVRVVALLRATRPAALDIGRASSFQRDLLARGCMTASVSPALPALTAH